MDFMKFGRPTIQRKTRASRAAFTLAELLVAIVIFATVMAGIIFGYVQTDRFAEWSSMSLAAHSYALEGLESVRGQKWDLAANPIIDALAIPAGATSTNLPPLHDNMDVPVSGAPYPVTNYITLSKVTMPSSSQAQLRKVQSQVIWIFPMTSKAYTNTVTTYRAPDRQ